MPKPISWTRELFPLQSRGVGIYTSDFIDAASIAELAVYLRVTAGTGTVKYRLESSADNINFHPVADTSGVTESAPFDSTAGNVELRKYTVFGKIVRIVAEVETADVTFSMLMHGKL